MPAWRQPPLRRLTLPLRLACVLGLVVVPAACSATTDPAADGRLVFCLSPDQATNLVNAAVAIGVAGHGATPQQLLVDGQSLAVSQWRAGHGADFDRTCQALASAPREPTTNSAADSTSTGLLGDLQSVLLLLAGAFVSLLSGSLKYGIDRRRLQATQLHSAAESFRLGYADYRTARQGGAMPASDPIQERRQNLVAQLREVLALHPSWAHAEEANQLLNNKLDMEFLLEHSRRDLRNQDEAPGEVDTALGQLAADVSRTVRRLRRPIRGLWTDRRR